MEEEEGQRGRGYGNHNYGPNKKMFLRKKIKINQRMLECPETAHAMQCHYTDQTYPGAAATGGRGQGV